MSDTPIHRNIGIAIVAVLATALWACAQQGDTMSAQPEAEASEVAAATPRIEGIPPEQCLEETPLPDDFNVAPAPENVPADDAAFLGVWSNGKWNGILCGTLVVTKVYEGGKADVIYSIGKSQYLSPEYWERTATIKDGKLQFTLGPWGAHLSYEFPELDADGLNGTYVHPRVGEWNVTLTKMGEY